MGKDKRAAKRNGEISKREEDIITALRLQVISLKLTMVQIENLIESLQSGDKIYLPEELSEFSAMASLLEG